MILTATPTPVSVPASTEAGLLDDEQARMELIQSLPVRLEASMLRRVMVLHEQQEPVERISRQLHLDRLVVALEIRRELEHREDPHRSDLPDCSRLTRLEWNHVARGSHIPNRPLRVLIEREMKTRPGVTFAALLRQAGISDVTHADRLLGVKAYTGSSRPSQTISCEQAARLVRAIGLCPVEVPGL